MADIELSRDDGNHLYPDIAEAGGLSNALRDELGRLGSQLDVTSGGHVEVGSRSCSLYMASHERLFTVSFWGQNVDYGKGSTQSLPELASAIVYWVQENLATAAMEERIQWFDATEIGRAHEAGRLIDYQWQTLLELWQRDESSLAEPAHSPVPLIEAARHRPELRKLFPFTSVFELCFSRSTGTPFARNCPSVEALVEGGYRVYSERAEERTSRFGDRIHVRQVLGEVSTLDEAMDLLVAHLPREEGEG